MLIEFFSALQFSSSKVTKDMNYEWPLKIPVNISYF